MNITISSSGNNLGSFNYYKNTNFIHVINENFTFNNKDINTFREHPRAKKIISDDPKILIEIHKSPLHHLINTYGSILNGLNLFENPTFVFNTKWLTPADIDYNLVEFFYFFIKDNNINRVYLDPSKDEDVLINNFYYSNFSQEHPIPNPINLINKSFLKYVIKTDKPYKKVYLSRKKNIANTASFDQNNTKLIQEASIRLFDEEILEEYFKNKNFEIIYPENFNSFIEQINYFNKVKTLVSLSGGALMNGILMQPKGNLIEISTDLITPHSAVKSHGNFVKAHHHFGHNVAHEIDLYFYSIKNETKYSNDIINKIENNKYLKKLINE